MGRVRSKHTRVPELWYNSLTPMKENLDTITTKAIMIRDKILLGEFKCKKRKKRGKEIYDIEVVL